MAISKFSALIPENKNLTKIKWLFSVEHESQPRTRLSPCAPCLFFEIVCGRHGDIHPTAHA